MSNNDLSLIISSAKNGSSIVKISYIFILGACSLLIGNSSWRVGRADVFTLTISGPPVVTSFSPIQSEVGASVEIKGTNLLNVISVQFNGAEAKFSTLSGLLSATVPTNATTGPITVKTTDGTNTTAQAFIVIARAVPIVSSFSPTEGAAGISVEIRGTNLAGVTAVKFNGAEASFTLLASSVVASVPANATSGAITVTTATGSYTTAGAFTVTRLAPPSVAGFSPLQGEPGTSVEILGTNLTSVSAVKFNGVAASFLSVGGSLRATVPVSATSGPITVITAFGTNTTTQVFTVTTGPTPVIANFTPAGGEIGTIIEIRGTYLRDVTAVRFDGVEANFTNSLFRPLAAVVPTNATTGPITVITRGGIATTLDLFIVTNLFAPIIEAVSPLAGMAGTLVEVRGTNLTVITAVEFNGVRASFLEFSAGRLFTFVPTNAPSGPIRVISANGAGKSKETFTVISSPATQEPPVLSMRTVSENQIELSWTAEAIGFVLQVSDDLSSSTNWSNQGGSPTTVQGRRALSQSVSSKARFYRLIHP